MKKTKTCPACHTKMTAHHGNYTKCPTNITRNTPTPTHTPTVRMLTLKEETEHSTIGTALKMYNQTDTTLSPTHTSSHLTETNVEVIINISKNLHQQHKTQILNNIYQNISTRRKIALIKKLKLSDENDSFLTQIATDKKTPRKVLKELSETPTGHHGLAYTEGYYRPNYIRIAKERLADKRKIRNSLTAGFDLVFDKIYNAYKWTFYQTHWWNRGRWNSGHWYKMFYS